MAMNKATMKRLFSAAFQIRAYSAPAERAIPPAKQKYVPTSGTYPKGFLAGTSHAGVKASNTRFDDVALVVSEQPCAAAATFTRNIFKAAPVQVSNDMVRSRDRSDFRGVVVNSGCANAVTGKIGRQDAVEMARVTDRCLGEDVDPHAGSEVLKTMVMSTGVIGQRLPMDKIRNAIPKAHAALGSTHEHWMKAAQAICTTDTFPKLLSRTFTLPSHPETEYRIAGMTKGAGMIHPNMGTLLGIICTDAKIAPDRIRHLLIGAVNHSFNSISIDGDTSTNDTVALFANGAAAPPDAEPVRTPTIDERNAGIRTDDDARAFRTVLTEMATDLAKLVVRDGEGATKFVTVRVQADSIMVARQVATSIATSSLVKTALYGKDANWGRILCAIGYAPGVMYNPSIIPAPQSEPGAQMPYPPVRPGETSVSFIPADGSAELSLLRRGEPEEVDEVRAKEILEMEDLEILVRLNDGGRMADERAELDSHEAVMWTCDFSHEYVTINGDYRT